MISQDLVDEAKEEKEEQDDKIRWDSRLDDVFDTAEDEDDDDDNVGGVLIWKLV
mgnify:CR=1 FL=1